MLSTFKVDSLRIKTMKRRNEKDGNDILSEAIYLMQNHFIKKHLYKVSDWIEIKEDLKKYKSQSQVFLLFYLY
jgi:hypothetical protein